MKTLIILLSFLGIWYTYNLEISYYLSSLFSTACNSTDLYLSGVDYKRAQMESAGVADKETYTVNQEARESHNKLCKTVYQWNNDTIKLMKEKDIQTWTGTLEALKKDLIKIEIEHQSSSWNYIKSNK